MLCNKKYVFFCFRYLIQGQLIGDSSIEGYIQALKKGCRCLECKNKV